MSAARWLYRGIRRFLVSLGFAAWLLLVTIAALAASTSVEFEFFVGAGHAPERSLAAVIGVLLVGVASVLALRIGNRLPSFALVIVFGALLLGYGVGALTPVRAVVETIPAAPLAGIGAAALACALGAGAVRSPILGYAIVTVTLVAPLLALVGYAWSVAGIAHGSGGASANAGWEILFGILGGIGGAWVIASVWYGVLRRRRVPQPRA